MEKTKGAKLYIKKNISFTVYINNEALILKSFSIEVIYKEYFIFS
jgi:hypothetical protein